MKTVKWTQLASMDYGVTNVLAHRQYWSVGARWQTPPGGRVNTAVLIPLRTAVTYQPERAPQTAQPGDLVFYPDDSHVGIVGGKDADGNLLIVHCSGGANGVVITGAAGFTAAARPDCFANES